MPIPRVLRHALNVALLMALSSPLLCQAAGDVRSMNLQEITSRSGRIFEGTCTASRIERDPKSGLIVTVYTFEVHDTLKGAPAQIQEIRQYGGILPDGEGVVVGAMTRYQRGERSILFMHEPSSIGLTSPVGLSQGVFKVVQDPQSQELRVVNQLRGGRLFRGIDTGKLVRRDAKGRVLVQDRPLLRALQSNGKGAKLDDFKVLVRRMVETRPSDQATTRTKNTLKMGVKR